MATKRKSGLGKGLEALFVDNTTEDITPLTLKTTEIEPNSGQPRKEFNDAALAELADSITEHGVLQPLVVRPLPNGRYQIVAGERRWRASRMAGLSELPVIIKELTETQAMEIALIENLQREDLTPLEEALGYRSLMEEYGLSQDTVAKRVGKSRPAVANALRLLHLPEEVRALLAGGKLTAGHARALLALETPRVMLDVANKVIAGALSVRQTEKLVAQRKKGEETPSKGVTRGEWGNGYYREVALALTNEIGHNVKVAAKNDKGKIEIAFGNRQELDAIIALLSKLDK